VANLLNGPDSLVSLLNGPARAGMGGGVRHIRYQDRGGVHGRMRGTKPGFCNSLVTFTVTTVTVVASFYLLILPYIPAVVSMVTSR
jgi:hypothetical protein